jgi:hypothetical protein
MTCTVCSTLSPELNVTTVLADVSAFAEESVRSGMTNQEFGSTSGSLPGSLPAPVRES